MANNSKTNFFKGASVRSRLATRGESNPPPDRSGATDPGTAGNIDENMFEEIQKMSATTRTITIRFIRSSARHRLLQVAEEKRGRPVSCVSLRMWWGSWWRKERPCLVQSMFSRDGRDRSATDSSGLNFHSLLFVSTVSRQTGTTGGRAFI